MTPTDHWPPPAKGTHESDLSRAHVCRLAPRDTPLSTHPDPDIFQTARDWSRSL